MTPPSLARTSVLIDASALSSVAAKSGVGTYVRNLVAALAPLTEGTDAGLAVNALLSPQVCLDPRVGRRTIHRRAGRRARLEVVEHAVRVPFDVWRMRHEGEVFHNPGFHAPAAIAHPWVQTLLDVIPLALDDPDQEVLRKRWQRFGPRYRRADAVVAISRHAADEGIRLLGLDPSRVHVVHLGVDPAFSPSSAPPPGNGSAGPPYVLLVGEYSRRKGFDHAFAVISALADAGYPHRLKVAGQVRPFARPELEQLRARAGRPERIEVLGYVDDLPALYRQAAAVLVPSRYEGFGLPALEAMASGVPVVAFANTALREVVGPGGCLVDDGDTDAMLKALRLILDHPDAASEWRAKGLQRAARFTWSESAARHAEVYRAVAGQVRPVR